MNVNSRWTETSKRLKTLGDNTKAYVSSLFGDDSWLGGVTARLLEEGRERLPLNTKISTRQAPHKSRKGVD